MLLTTIVLAYTAKRHDEGQQYLAIVRVIQNRVAWHSSILKCSRLKPFDDVAKRYSAFSNSMHFHHGFCMMQTTDSSFSGSSGILNPNYRGFRFWYSNGFPPAPFHLELFLYHGSYNLVFTLFLKYFLILWSPSPSSNIFYSGRKHAIAKSFISKNYLRVYTDCIKSAMTNKLFSTATRWDFRS